MGTCGTSKFEDPNEIQRLRNEYIQLQNKNKEQQNLLRFKIEVLINMLAVEEKKSEHTLERLEVLKWELFQKGVDEEKLTKILQKTLNSDNDENRDDNSNTKSLINARLNRNGLSDAIERAFKEFDSYRSDIIPAFADDEGKFEASMDQREFMKRLYMTTESLIKPDIELIALRFSDETGSVNVPEFIDFFTSSGHIRTARAANHAVQMSLDMLHIQQDPNESNELQALHHLADDKNINHKEFVTTHLTQYLDSGVSKLLIMWPIISDELLMYYEDEIEPHIEDEYEKNESLIEFQIFKDLLIRFCGYKTKSNSLVKEKNKRDELSKSIKATAATKANITSITNIETIDFLNNEDIDLITERFELSKLVHFKHFFKYFVELHHNKLILQRKLASSGTSNIHHSLSPFRISSEWKHLRDDTTVKKYTYKEISQPSEAKSLPEAIIAPPKSEKTFKPLPPPDNDSDIKHQKEKIIIDEKKNDEKLKKEIDEKATLLAEEKQRDEIISKNKNEEKNEVPVAEKTNTWLCCGVPIITKKKELSKPETLSKPIVEEVVIEKPKSMKESSSYEEKTEFNNGTYQKVDIYNSKKRNNDDFIIKTDAILRKLRESIIDYLGPYVKNANKVKEIFREIDRDNSGKIDSIEFKQSMKILKIHLTNDEIDLIFKRFDPDDNGIDYDEFLDFLDFDFSNNQSNKNTSSKSIRNNIDNNEIIGDKSFKSPKYSASPMKKASAFKPKVSYLKDNDEDISFNNNNDDDDDNHITTRWKK